MGRKLSLPSQVSSLLLIGESYLTSLSFFLSLSLRLKTEKEGSIPFQVFVYDQSL